MEKGQGKRKLSAYNIFMKEKRKLVLEENPSMKSKDVMRKVAEMWREISDEEKMKYTEMAESQADDDVSESQQQYPKKSDRKESILSPARAAILFVGVAVLGFIRKLYLSKSDN